MGRVAVRIAIYGILTSVFFVSAGCIGSNCVEDSDCGDGFFCQNSACFEKKQTCSSPALVCSAASDCQSNRCEDGCCAVSCASRLDCAEDEECRSGICRKPDVTDGCKANRDCAGASPICQVATGICVGCLSTADCGDNGVRVCGAGNQCVLDSGRCENSNSCLVGQQCVNTFCVDAPCERDDECRQGFICAGGMCQAPFGCSENSDCGGATPFCRSSDRACVACLAKSDCAENHVCMDGECKAVSCSDDSECEGSAPACEISTGRCVACLTDDHCGYGEECKNKACERRRPVGNNCASDAECIGDGVLCAEGYCRARCPVYEYPSRCPHGSSCTSLGSWEGGEAVGACLPISGAREGEICSDNVACDASLECVPETTTEGRCRRWCDPDGTGVCEGGNTCRRVVTLDLNDVPHAHGLCYPPSSKYFDACYRTSECGPGLVCGAGIVRNLTGATNICQRPQGTKKGLQLCGHESGLPVDTETCETGFCVQSPGMRGGTNYYNYSGQCQESCSDDAQCPSGSACAMVPFESRKGNGDVVVDEVTSCVATCEQPSDCRFALGIKEVCALQLNRVGTAWVQRCKPPVNESVKSNIGGASCSADDECSSGVCLQSPAGGICMGFCNPAKFDCDAGLACPAGGVELPRTEIERLYGADFCKNGNPLCLKKFSICWPTP